MFTLRFYCPNFGTHVLQTPHYSVASFINRKVITVYPGLTTENGVEYLVSGNEQTQAPSNSLSATGCVISDFSGRTVDSVSYALNADQMIQERKV